jgi:hypothetical protein
MSWDEGVERVLKMSQPCFRAVEMTERRVSKGFGAGLGAETARDFHFDLHHADVLLGLIVAIDIQALDAQ